MALPKKGSPLGFPAAVTIQRRLLAFTLVNEVLTSPFPHILVGVG